MNTLIPQQICTKIELEMNGTPSNFEIIGKGSNYDVYKFSLNNSFYVLRLQKRVTYDFSPVESKLLIKLNGSFSPKLFIYDSGKTVGFPFMVLSFIDGKHLADLNAEQLKIVLKTIKQVHESTKQNLRHPELKDYYIEIYKEKFGNKFIPDTSTETNISSQMASLADKLHNKINSLPSTATSFECLIHGDLNPNNLLWVNNNVYFIDWELARYSIPAIEYGGLLYCNGKNKEIFNHVLSFFNNDEKELIVTGFYLKLLDSLCWRIKYLKQIKLNKEEYEYHLSEFNHDLEKSNFPN